MRSEAVSIAPQTVLPITKYFGPEIFLKPQKKCGRIFVTRGGSSRSYDEYPSQPNKAPANINSSNDEQSDPYYAHMQTKQINWSSGTMMLQLHNTSVTCLIQALSGKLYFSFVWPALRYPIA